MDALAAGSRPPPDRPIPAARRGRPRNPDPRLFRRPPGPEPGPREHVRAGHGARHLLRRRPDPGGRARPARRGRPDRPVRADLHGAPSRRRPRSERVRADGPDGGGRRDGDHGRGPDPRRPAHRRRGRRQPQRSGSGDVRRPVPDQLPDARAVRGVDRDRRDPRREPAVLLLRARPDPLPARRDRSGRCLFADTLGIYAPAWGTVAGAAAHLAARAAGSFRTSFRYPALAAGPDRRRSGSSSG